MDIVLIILVLLLIFGGGWWGYGYRRSGTLGYGLPGIIVTILVIVLLVYLIRGVL